jgi:hypothetical protein
MMDIPHSPHVGRVASAIKEAYDRTPADWREIAAAALSVVNPPEDETIEESHLVEAFRRLAEHNEYFLNVVACYEKLGVPVLTCCLLVIYDLAGEWVRKGQVNSGDDVDVRTMGVDVARNEGEEHVIG